MSPTKIIRNSLSSPWSAETIFLILGHELEVLIFKLFVTEDTLMVHRDLGRLQNWTEEYLKFIQEMGKFLHLLCTDVPLRY